MKSRLSDMQPKILFKDGRVFFEGSWNESDHPRGKTTEPSTPGSFAPSTDGGGGSSSAIIMIRPSTKNEDGSATLKRRAFQSFPEIEGTEVVYMPYGEQGRGFYRRGKMSF